MSNQPDTGSESGDKDEMYDAAMMTANSPSSTPSAKTANSPKSASSALSAKTAELALTPIADTPTAKTAIANTPVAESEASAPSSIGQPFAVHPDTKSTDSGYGSKEGTVDTAQSNATNIPTPKSTSSTPSLKTAEPASISSADTPIAKTPIIDTPSADTPMGFVPISDTLTGKTPSAESKASSRFTKTEIIRSSSAASSFTVYSSSSTGTSSKEEAREQAKEEFLETVAEAGEALEIDHVSDDDHYQPIDLILIMIPVTLCMLFVVLFTVLITDAQEEKTRVKPMMALSPFDSKTDDIGTKTWQTLANVGILIGTVALMTFVVVGLYMCYCYKCLLVLLAIPVIVVNLVFTWAYLNRVLKAFNVSMDHITAALLSINFGMIGILSILGRTPKVLQQFYLLYLCGVMASLYLSYMPDWTVSGFLAALAVWGKNELIIFSLPNDRALPFTNLIAVLAPCGPLRILVETVQNRDHDFIPAMIYTTAAYLMADEDKKSQKKKPTKPKEGSEKKEKRRLRLGLGDFVFYSLLTGKATQQTIVHTLDVDWTIVIGCFVAIIVGLLATIILLVMAQKALPALPISIALGLVFSYSGFHLVSPFCALMATNQIFI